jgi:HSP20 family protein
MPKKKKQPKESKKTKMAVVKKKAPAAPLDLLRTFDDVFERFRSDFEDLLFPSYWDRELSMSPETRIPAVDLEDREKDYMLKAEMPGFKKEDIEIEVKEDSIEITGKVGWKYDKKEQAYVCKERACESFYRMVELPEEIKVDDVSADLSEGVLEITLPKRAPKRKRKVSIK